MEKLLCGFLLFRYYVKHSRQESCEQVQNFAVNLFVDPFIENQLLIFLVYLYSILYLILHIIRNSVHFCSHIFEKKS